MLPQGVVYLFVGLAVLMTLLWAVLEVRIPLTGVSGLIAWAVLALRGEAVVVYSQGSEFVTQTPALRYYALLMALLTGIALLLWQWGDFPPEESEGETEVAVRQRIGGIPIKTIQRREE